MDITQFFAVVAGGIIGLVLIVRVTCNAVLSTMEHIAITIQYMSLFHETTPFSGTLDLSREAACSALP